MLELKEFFCGFLNFAELGLKNSRNCGNMFTTKHI